MKENLQIRDVRSMEGDSAFLLDDGRTTVLYDTGYGFTGKRVAENIRAVLGERKLDYIFLTHSHYDHAMGTAWIRRAFPEVKIAAGRYADSIFRRPGARRVMAELDGKRAEECGCPVEEYPWDDLQVDIPCDDGDILRAGDMTFQVVDLPGHTRCSVGFYCPERKLLLAAETLGLYDGRGGIVPSYLVNYGMSLQSMDRVAGMDIDRILSPHFGLLTREETAEFLRNMKPAAVSMTEVILDVLRAGRPEREVWDWFRDTLWHGHIREIYPVAAAEMNIAIMIAQIRKEFAAELGEG